MANTDWDIEQFRKTLKGLPAELLERAGQALYEEALVMKDASMERTPVASGSLRASHDVDKPEGDGTKVRVVIRVGGSSAPYAYFVHENLEINHNAPHRNPSDGKVYTCGGEAKFLETSVREGSEGLGARIAARMR